MYRLQSLTIGLIQSINISGLTGLYNISVVTVVTVLYIAMSSYKPTIGCHIKASVSQSGLTTEYQYQSAATTTETRSPNQVIYMYTEQVKLHCITMNTEYRVLIDCHNGVYVLILTNEQMLKGCTNDLMHQTEGCFASVF